MYGRAIDQPLDERSLPQTNPPAEPSALLSVPMRTCTRSSTPSCFGQAPAARAEHARRMRFVDQQHAVESLGQFGQFDQRRQIAVHAEDAFGDDQPAAKDAAAERQLRVQRRESRCGYTCTSARDSRQPSIMLA